MTTWIRLSACIALALCLPGLASAQDVEGSSDHPLVSRFPGYVITQYDAQDFGAHEFQTASGARRVEGRYWRIDYEIGEGARKAGPLELARNYAKAFTSRGGSRAHEDVDANGGTMVCSLPVAGHTTWLEVSVGNNGELYTLTVVEEAAVVQKVEFTGSELAARLAEDGMVTLRSIQFDSGKATLTPGSLPTLEALAEALRLAPQLSVAIHGHTDATGTAAANLRLSRDRAAAVAGWLVQQGGIAADRLAPSGFGDTKPVGNNGTDEGRALNRRVEIVRR